VDALWKQHTAHRFDPAKHLPIEILNLIFSFVTYNIVELEPEDPFWPGELTAPSRETIAGYRDAPLILTSVSIGWCHIAANNPLLWSTIIIDRSEDDYLERIHLFLDRSGNLLLDVILLDPITPAAPLHSLLIRHAHRFKALVGQPVNTKIKDFPLARLEPLSTPANVVKWSVYGSRNRRVSSVPIPKGLHRVQLYHWKVDPDSLIQFTYFPNLESLSISIELEPKHSKWVKKLRFGLLRHLRLSVSNAHWPVGSTLESPWIEWLECPALLDLYLVYELNQTPSKEMYPQLETCLLCLGTLRSLRVHMHTYDAIDQEYDASGFQSMRPSMFEGNLELAQLTFLVPHDTERSWAGPFTERFFSVFVPNTHLTWEYGHFPSPTIFTNVKIMRLVNWIEGDRSTLVAPDMAKLEFPFLEELYIQSKIPRLLDLRAPRLISLGLASVIPSDLRHISDSTLACINLKVCGDDIDSWETYLPPADKLELHLPINDMLRLDVHPSRVHAVAITVIWDKDITCPPHWTVDHISEMLGTVTDLNLQYLYTQRGFLDPSQTIVSFLKPFMYLKRLVLFQSKISKPTHIDQFAQHLVDPNFLPVLDALTTSEYPSWPDFFQYIQHRQSGFLTGHFQTALKEITIQRPVHGAILEHLRESLAGRYVGPMRMPPRRKGSKEWPAQPFDWQEVDTSGLLFCSNCYRAGLETGCMVLPSDNAIDMLACTRHKGDWELHTVFAP